MKLIYPICLFYNIFFVFHFSNFTFVIFWPTCTSWALSAILKVAIWVHVGISSHAIRFGLTWAKWPMSSFPWKKWHHLFWGKRQILNSESYIYMILWPHVCLPIPLHWFPSPTTFAWDMALSFWGWTMPKLKGNKWAVKLGLLPDETSTPYMFLVVDQALGSNFKSNTTTKH